MYTRNLFTFSGIVFLLTFMLLSLGCEKDDDSNPNSSNNNSTNVDTSVTSKFYFRAKVGGEWVILEDGKNGYGSGIRAFSSSKDDTCQTGQGLVFEAFNQEELIQVLFLETIQCDEPCPQVKNMISFGSYTYGEQDEKDGVEVTYVDENGKEWVSSYGPAHQSNSNFKVTKNIENTDDNISEEITKAVFNCTLYDSTGNSKVLKQGEIHGRSGKCF